MRADDARARLDSARTSAQTRAVAVQRLLLGLARRAVRVYYRAQYLGGAVPERGPLLLVGNHPNSLVDPVLLAGTTRRPVRFLGKAPLFDMPVLGRVLRGLEAVPVHRAQDGDTSANERTFAAVHEALARGELVCLFPEGRSHDEPALAKLKTGAARMALGAEQQAGWRLGVRIVPVGLVYRAKPGFRSRVAVWTGSPIALEDLAAAYARDERAAVLALTGRIAAGLGAVTLDLERWADLPLLELAERILFSERPEGAERLARVQAFARALRTLRAREPAAVDALGARIAAFGERLARLGIEPHALPDRLVLPYRAGAVLRFLGRGFLELLFGLPLAALGAGLWFLPYRVAGAVPRRFAEPDTLATMRILAACLFFPLWLALLVALAWWRLGGLAALALFLVAPPLGLLTLSFRDWRIHTQAEVRTFLCLSSRSRLRALLLEERAGLARELEALRARLLP